MSRHVDWRRIVENGLEWASVIAGLAILGSCTAAGFRGGKTLGFGMLLLGIAVALIIVGWVFLMTRMSGDIRLIRQRLESLGPEPPTVETDPARRGDDKQGRQ